MLILAELTPLDPVTGLRETVRLSGADVAEVCGYDDEEWFPAISQQQGLGFALFDGAFQDGSKLTPLTMTAGLSAYIAQYPQAARYVWTGASASILAYEDGAATTLIDGKIRSAGSAAYTFEFSIEVDEEPFKADVLSYYAGTTGLEGHGNLKGRPKPWLLGRCFNVEPVFLDLVDNVYQVSAYGPIAAIEAVYERGASFGLSVGDFASFEALVAADIPPSRWGTCLALGLFRLGAPAAGVITADVIGDTAAGRTTGAILKRIATFLGIVKVATASLDALDSAVPRNTGEYLTDQTDFLGLAQRMALVRNAVAGIDWTGNLFISRLAQTDPVFSLDAQARTWPPVTRTTERGVSPPFKRIAFGAERSWRVHTFDEVAFDEPLTDRGAWVAGEWYKRGNLVTHPDGKLWLYIANDPGNQGEPGTDASVWSNRSSNLTPTGAYDAARTYYPDDLTTWTDGNAYVRIGTGPTTGVDPSDDTKWQFFLGGNDTITQDGRIQRRVYTTSATQPDTPTGDNVPQGWSDNPTDQPRWVSEALQELDFTLVDGETWSVPKEDGHKGEPGAAGDDGLPGYNTALISIFARSTTQPSMPATGTLTWDFVNKTLSGLPAGMTYGSPPPDNGEPPWQASVSFSSRSSIDTADYGEVSSFTGLPGGGADGLNQKTVFLFQRAAVRPDTPIEDVIYNFATKQVSNLTNNWHATHRAPVGSGDPEWVTTATASSIDDTDAIPPTEWAVAEVFTKDGEDGQPGDDGAPGEDGFTISPASYSATVAASSSGVVETGQLPITVALKLLRGTTDLTADAATSYALSQTGGAGTLGGANNSVLSINSIAADTYKGTVSVSYNGVVIGSVEATVTKSKQGSAAVSAKDTTITVPTASTYGAVHGGPLTILSGTDGSVKLSCSIIYETTTNSVRLAGKIQYRTSSEGEAYSAWADAAPETEASEIAFPGEPGFLAFSHTLAHSGEGKFYQTRLQLRTISGTVPSSVGGNFATEWSA